MSIETPDVAPEVGVGTVWDKKDIADFLKVSTEHVRRLIEHKGLPVFDLGTGTKQHEYRAYPEDVVAWTKRQQIRPVE